MIVTNVASSSQSGIPANPNVTATLKTNATEIASAIRVIIPGDRSRISLMPPLMKGVPPYRNTAVANTAGTHVVPGKCGGENGNARCSMSPQTTVGNVRASEIQN